MGWRLEQLVYFKRGSGLEAGALWEKSIKEGLLEKEVE